MWWPTKKETRYVNFHPIPADHAVGAGKDSLKALRSRIIDLVRHVPVGVKLTDNQGVIVEVAPPIQRREPVG